LALDTKPGRGVWRFVMIQIRRVVGVATAVAVIGTATVAVASPAFALRRSSDCSTALAQLKVDRDMMNTYLRLSEEAYAAGDQQNGWGYLRIANIWHNSLEAGETNALNAGCF
jgi:hypothetical protein